MTGIWFISYVVLWLLVLGGGVVILILAREIEALHQRQDAIERRKTMQEVERVSLRPSNVTLHIPGP